MLDGPSFPPLEGASNTMTEAYQFCGANEFTRLPKMTARTFNLTQKAFEDSFFDVTYSEIPLPFLSKWYQSLPEFRCVLENSNYQEKDSFVSWQFSLIILNPGAASVKDKKANALSWATDLARDFLNSVFSTNVDDAQAIGAATLLEFTLLLVARKSVSTTSEPAKPQYAAYTKQTKNAAKGSTSPVMVLAAACFRHGDNEETGKAFLTFMAVAEKTDAMPEGIATWRCLGIGRFLIIVIIKRLTMSLLKFRGQDIANVALQDVEIYLQTTTPAAFQFYRRCGFHQIDDDDSTDRGLLPTSLQTRQDEEGTMWWISVEIDEQLPRLLCLFSGQLLKKPDVISINDSPVKATHAYVGSSFWCQYPEPTIVRSNLPMLTEIDVRQLFSGMDLLDNLLPPPMKPLLPPGSLNFSGEFIMKNRINHGENAGKAWMSTGELDMMTALLLRDGRYKDDVSIVSFTLVETIEVAFEAYKKFVQFQAFKQEYEKDKEQDLIIHVWGEFNVVLNDILVESYQPTKKKDKKIKKGVEDFVTSYREKYRAEFRSKVLEQFEKSEHDMRKDWRDQQDHVVKNILSVQPGLIQKKLLVFPKNLVGAHWMVTFVFNPSSIDEEVASYKGLRPCFYRYCSMSPFGTRSASVSQGLQWFLTLAYNHTFHNKPDSSGVMKMRWKTPFGTTVDGDLIGTESFPSLRAHVTKPPSLPIQGDGYNCGIGVVSMIAIVLRDCIGHGESDQVKFLSVFSKKEMEVSYVPGKKEYVCKLPEHTFPSLPMSLVSAGKAYLDAVKEQWFIVIDRLAELQHVTLPKRQDPGYQVDKAYTACINDLKEWAWPNARGTNETSGASVVKTLFHDIDDLHQSLPPLEGGKESSRPGEDFPVSTDASDTPYVFPGTVKDVPASAAKPLPTDDSDGESMTGSLKLQHQSPPPLEDETKMAVQGDVPVSNDDRDMEKEMPATKVKEVSGLAAKHAPTANPQSAKKKLSSSAKVKEVSGLAVKGPPTTNPRSGKKKLPASTKVKEVSKPAEDSTAVVRKKWRHIEVIPDENSTADDALSDWPSFASKPEVVSDDDWDGKTKEPNNWKQYWKDSCDGDPKYFFGDEVPQPVTQTKARFPARLSDEGIDKFTSLWYSEKKKSNGNRPIPKLDPKMMEKFVDYSFRNWGWSSEKQYQKDLAHQRNLMKSLFDQAKTMSSQLTIKIYYQDLLKSMKRERNYYRRWFQTQYKLGNPASVTGLKYNSETDTFTARCEYELFDKEANTSEKQVEEMIVSEEWVQLAGFAEGVVEHVINMNTGDTGFTPVPEGTEILMNTRKISRVKYVQPSTRWVLDLDAVRVKAQHIVDEEKKLLLNTIAEESGTEIGSPARRRSKDGGPDLPDKSPKSDKSTREGEEISVKKQVTIGGHWEVIFVDTSEVMRTDEDFVKTNFRKAYLEELKRVKKGFVDIPVGDYKVSHLDEHPSLKVYGAPKVHYPQSEGQDLCVSKSLSSALHVLGFEEEASRLDDFGMTNLKGGAVDAFGKVTQYAIGLLPNWIQRKYYKKDPATFNWQSDLDPRIILLGVLEASDGNCSHAITVHGGFIYDANEVVSIPLCQEALDYCTSTPTEKSTFVNFRRICFFFYEGAQQDKVQRMTLKIKKERKPPPNPDVGGAKRKYRDIFL